MVSKRAERNFALRLIASLFAILSLNCGSGLGPGSPEIREFKFIGQDKNFTYRFYFQISWRDAEGDLSLKDNPGKLIIKVEDPDNQKSTPNEVSLPLNESLVKPGQKSGTIPEIAIDLAESSGNYPNRIKFTATLFDAKGHKSNSAWLILQKKN